MDGKTARHMVILPAFFLLTLTAIIHITQVESSLISPDEIYGKIQAAELPCSSFNSTYWAMRYTVETDAGWAKGAVIETKDGKFVVASSDADHKYWLTKIERDGTPIWQRSYGGSSNELLFSGTQTSDDGFIVSGSSSSFSGGSVEIWILKLDEAGDVIWQKSYGGFGSDEGRSIKQTTDGGYIVAGRRRTSPSDEDILIVRLDAGGDVIWNRKFGGDVEDPGNSVIQTQDGGFIVAGRTESLAPNAGSAWVLKLDAGGSIVWQNWYGRTWNEVRSVVNASGGGYLLAGSAIGQRGWLLRLNPDGTLLWEKKYTTEQTNSDLMEVKATSDGGYIAVGTLWDDHEINIDIWLLKVNSAGEVEWSKKYDASVEDTGFSVDQLGDGGYILSGSSRGTDNIDGILLRLDQAGNITNCHIDSDNPVLVAPDGVTVGETSVTDDVYPLTVQDTEIVPVNTGIWPIPICGVIPERFIINYSSGAPGSYFSLTGRSFPGDSEVNVSINDFNLGSVLPDSNGEIFFLLLTTGADEGVYVVRAQKGSEIATTSFRLDASQPLRPQEGAGPLFNVPPGISLSELNLLPFIRSG